MGAENVNRVGHEPEGLPVPNRAPKGAKPAAALHRFVNCSASECRVDIDVTRENGRFPRGRMAGPAGFEPATFASGGQRSIQLSYGSAVRSEEHTSELQSLMRISYAVFCLKQK